ncbi:MAG: endonuclease NucS [Aigarchaeota archaeon]|nr:endonuclease NucS [Candidatus Calditenuaceae archaeon]
MASIEQIRDYIRRRIQEGVDVLYGEGGLAGEVARRFGLKTSSAGYRVWEVIRQLGGREASEKGSSKQIPLPSGEELEEGIKEREEELTKGGFALEEELERQVLQNISLVERGLSVKARQYKTEVGVADILAEDSARNLVVIELKRVRQEKGRCSNYYVTWAL